MTLDPNSARLRIAVLFGGRSAEHDVSVMSATNVMAALDVDKYHPVPVFVTREGRWLLGAFENGVLSRPAGGTEICLVAGGGGEVIAIAPGGVVEPLEKIDILFPVLHGLHGEDGEVQGLAEVARVPLAGCSILGSAAALDKDIAKRLLSQAGIATAPWLTIRQNDRPSFAAVESALGLPVFIKPARQGSSVGVNKVANAEQYEAALDEGFRHDNTLLAEQFVKGREIECSVIEDADGGLFVSRPGEIITAGAHAFYSYDAKYIDGDGALVKAPADLPPDTETAIREAAGQAFRAVGCDAMARVDFFLTPDMTFLVNEINTIPGFTDISMYSKAMAASGVSYSEILDRLVAHGLARARR